MRRFGTAALLRWTAACAVYLGLSTMIGYAPAAVLCASVAALTWAVVSKLSGWLWAARITVGFVASVALWFSAVVAVWSLETCDRCWSERYTIDYRVIGVTLISSEETVPTWRALAADGLGVSCAHQFKRIPYDEYTASFSPPLGPPNERGALLMILRSVFASEVPWWYYYDPTRKMYEYHHLLTEDYSPELASRLRQLSIDNPDVAKQFWGRIESDDYYLWDGLLTDQVVLTAEEKGDLHDAIKWLSGSSPQEERFFSSWDNKHAIDRVAEVQRHGVGEVLVYRINRGDNAKGGRWAKGMPVVRLPEDPALRGKAFGTLTKLHQAANPEATLMVDYGQQYVNAP